MMKSDKKSSTEASKADTNAETIKAKSGPGSTKPVTPYYTLHDDCERSQIIKKCAPCKDTSFEMLVKGKLSNRCCRCGTNYGL